MRSVQDQIARRRRSSLGLSYRKILAANIVSNLGDGVSGVAYPWLASAITRNPMLIAAVAIAQRLPWLVFTLPAGVITDRVDRRRAMVAMDSARAVVTALVALMVFVEQGSLPAPDALAGVVGTRWVVYGAVLLATFLLGMAEVLRDNSAQTILPAVVAAENLERANGQMWSAESVANTFVGPPLGSLLLAAAFALPFFLDAASFFAAAALVATVPGTFRAARPDKAMRTDWSDELREGVRWLWANDLLRQMAIILGVMNAASMVSGATFVLFAQEVLDIGPFVFALVGMGGAVGAIIGGAVAPMLSRRLGSGTCLRIVLAGSVVVGLAMASTSWWPVACVLFAFAATLGIVWNVITVSLRQAIIPEHLLGRVNSVYRFFGLGMMPVGAAIGGLVVLAVGSFAGRDVALRATWVVYALANAVMFLVARTRLTTARIEAARLAAAR